MTPLISICILVACYAIGSIPFGYMLAKRRGIDIRTAGSRNIGATNVARVLGRKSGAVVLVLDVLKGFAPTLTAGRLLAEVLPAPSAQHYGLWIAAALACIFGHICPLYLRFKGGKGVATGLGATLGIFPELLWASLIAIAIWIVVLLVTRFVSVASIGAACAYPAAIWLTLRPPGWQTHWPLLAYGFLIPTVVLFRHRANLARLRAGTEPRIGDPGKHSAA